MDINLDRLVHTLLERQKEYVREDLNDYSCAMVVLFTADNDSFLSLPKWEDEVSKETAYAEIVQNAKQRNAMLVVTVNQARQRAGEARIDESFDEDFDESNSVPCILITASGPGMAACSYSLGYRITDNDVYFDCEPVYSSGILLNLLPDWPGITAGKIS